MYLHSGKKEECVGCQACVDACPKRCITMQIDEEGFTYPSIERERCISCGLCEKVCPIDFQRFSRKEEQSAHVGLYPSKAVIFDSSSGGAFTAIYQTALAQGYRVYGAKWGEGLQILHDGADTEEDCQKFRKSKYVLSDANHYFSKIEKELRAGRRVLFSGTPCQGAALLQYLETKKVDRENLFVVDLVCHGVASQTIFDRYIAESKKGITAFSFKNKAPMDGIINSRTARIEYQDGSQKIVSVRDDAYLKGYYGRLFYRPSCATCRFARIERCSDLTIADAWGVEELYPEYDALSGVSLFLVNTEKGRKAFGEIVAKMEVKSVPLDWAEAANAQLNRPTEMHARRRVFFENLSKKGFAQSVEKAMRSPLWKRCLRKVKTWTNRKKK